MFAESPSFKVPRFPDAVVQVGAESILKAESNLPVKPPADVIATA